MQLSQSSDYSLPFRHLLWLNEVSGRGIAMWVRENKLGRPLCRVSSWSLENCPHFPHTETLMGKQASFRAMLQQLPGQASWNHGEVQSCLHRIIESSRLEETFRLVWSDPPPSTAPVTPEPLNHITQTQMPFEELHHHAGQPIPTPDHPNSEKYFPNILSEYFLSQDHSL